MWMVEGRQRQEWSMFASLMALNANCHRDPKKGRAFKPDDFMPRFGPKRKPLQGKITDLKIFLPENKNGERGKNQSG